MTAAASTPELQEKNANTTSGKNERQPISSKLRQKATNIKILLDRYFILRYGDVTWRQGDDDFRKSGGQKGTGPGQAGTPPAINVVSSPQNIYLEIDEMMEEGNEATEEAAETEQVPSEQEQVAEVTEDVEGAESETVERRIANPFIQALTLMGEITADEAHRFQLDVKYNILTELGVEERYGCTALFVWARQLAGQLTYILETKELYSPEIKAIYQELLMDLDIARAECDKLAVILGKQNGVLTRKQFTTMIATILHYSEIAKQEAIQLADHHDEYMERTGTGVLQSDEMKWVLSPEDETPTAAESALSETDEESKTPKK